MGAGQVLHGKLLSLCTVMSLRSLQVLGLEERNAELEVEETKDKLEPTRTKWKPSLTMSRFNDVGNLQKLASFLPELHMHLAQNLQLKESGQELKSLQAQNLLSQASLSAATNALCGVAWHVTLTFRE